LLGFGLLVCETFVLGDRAVRLNCSYRRRGWTDLLEVNGHQTILEVELLLPFAAVYLMYR
jgi:hypothetical protein